MADAPPKLKEAVSEARRIADFRDRAAKDLKSNAREIESLTRELLSFSAAIDRKAVQELKGDESEIDTRPLTNQEQVKAGRMAEKIRDLRTDARKLARVVEKEISNAERGLDDLLDTEKRDVRASIRDLEKLKTQSEALATKAEVVARALSRARRRDDLKMILLKTAGVGAILALAATVGGLTVVGGVLAIKALLAFGLSRVIEEVEEVTK